VVALVKQAVMEMHLLPQTLVVILFFLPLHQLVVVVAAQETTTMKLTQMVKVVVPAGEVLLTLIQHM
jgi:hypothetical protein